VAVATATLLIMVTVNVWSRGKLRLYGVLIGLATGYALSLAGGLFGKEQLDQLRQSPWVAVPWIEGMTNISFRWSLLPTFLIVSTTGALKSVGNLIMCQKINDADWKEPNLDRVGRGLMADSVAVTISGLIGGMASDTSASNVALSSASGATSRSIGYAAGGLFVLLGFSPKISGLLSVMPGPVMGAIVVLVASFMILSAMQIILGAGVDTRKIFVVGIPFIFGLSLDVVPGLYVSIFPWLQPLFESSLTLAAIIAVALNQLLRTRQGPMPPAIAE
jgi:NCS2 family nucleobase:cation symporter-2